MSTVDELADNIEQYGLFKPLEVYEDEETQTYTLIGGHRRLMALTKLHNENRLLNSEVACIVYPRPKKTEGNVEERMKIILSNAQRDLDENDKVNLTKELLECLEYDPSLKKSGQLTRDWIAPFLGCKGVTAQKYINIAKGTHSKKQKKETENTSKELKDLYKLAEKYNKQLNDIFWKLKQEDREKVIGSSSTEEEITVQMLVTKLAGITTLLCNSIKKIN